MTTTLSQRVRDLFSRAQALALRPLLVFGDPSPSGDVWIWSTAGGNGSDMMQEAADEAMARGAVLRLGPGDFDLTSSGGPIMGTGPDMLRNGVAGNAYKALSIRGAGPSRTRLHVGAGQTGLHYANDTGAVGLEGRVEQLSIVGPGILSGAVGIQMGGRATDRSDLLENMLVASLEFDNLQACVILDDVSGFTGRELRLSRFAYGFEWGYNADSVRLAGLLIGPDESILNDGPAASTEASNAITVSADLAARLQVGYAINAPDVFPAGTYVGSIVGTTITAVDYNGAPVLAIASATLSSFYVGRVFNFGTRLPATAGALYPSAGSTFVSPYWSTIYPDSSGRISANNHTYEGMASGVERIFDCRGGGSNHNLTLSNFYSERISEGLLIGDPASELQAYNVALRHCYIGMRGRMLAPFIVIEAASPNFAISVQECFNDTETLAVPWLVCDAPYGTGRLTWENNNLPAYGGTVRLGAADLAYAAQPVIPFGGAMYLGSARRGDAIDDFHSGYWHFMGQDGMRVDLTTGSKALEFPATYNTLSRGKLFTLYVTGETGNELQLGVAIPEGWLGIDGMPIGTIASGPTGTSMALTFLWDGATMRALTEPAWA